MDRWDSIRFDSSRSAQHHFFLNFIYMQCPQVDTPSMARRKQDLEARVAEVGRHRALFLRPKVYIVEDGVRVDPDEGEGRVSVE